MIDLYSVLQIDRRAEPEVVRAAYRALARRHHPDFGGDARVMASINEAWAVLGDPDQRAAYDGEPQAVDDEAPRGQAPERRAPVGPSPQNEPVHGLAARRRRTEAGGSVLDFGRYAGWTVGALAAHDPAYLEWLARTPIGRRLAAEIDAALASHSAELAPQPVARPAARRSVFG